MIVNIPFPRFNLFKAENLIKYFLLLHITCTLYFEIIF